MSGSYVERDIDLTLTLGTGTFGSTGANTVKLSNLRIVATINKAGFPSLDTADLRIYGVPPDIMNEVSSLGVPFPMLRVQNTILIEAGDAVNGMATVYSGYMGECYQELGDAPETFLHIRGLTGAPASLVPATPTSVRGTADVATIMSGIATKAGWGFENSGVAGPVNVKLSNPYLDGTYLEQGQALARAANIEMTLDSAGGATGTLAIWAKNTTRGGNIPLISPSTGLVGYPQFFGFGLKFRCILNRNIKIGGQIQMQSSLGGPAAAANLAQQPATPATQAAARQQGVNGTWYVITPLTYSLASQLPGGPWFTDVTCARLPGTPGASP
jgi:hypothetical protein